MKKIKKDTRLKVDLTFDEMLKKTTDSAIIPKKIRKKPIKFKDTIILLLLTSLILLSSCQITPQQKRRAEQSTRWPIVWQSERGNPYAKSGKIYINPHYLESRGVSHQLIYVVEHETAHLNGYWWECSKENCLLAPEIPWFGRRKICNKCLSRLKPTMRDWLSIIVRPVK